MNKKKGFSPIVIIVIILSILLIGILIFVFINSNNNKNKSNNDDYLGWKSYTSSYGGISFYYPNNWSTSDISSTDKKLSSRVDSDADKIQLLDSNKKPLVYWSTYSTNPKIPGCDVNTKPGITSSIKDPDNRTSYLKGCAEIIILSKQQLSNFSNIYYIEGIITNDSRIYTPVCAISSDSNTDIIKSYNFAPWFISKKSKNKSNKYEVQFLCQSSSLESNTSGLPEYSGTKDEATAVFKKEPFITIKKLMLSIKST